MVLRNLASIKMTWFRLLLASGLLAGSTGWSDQTEQSLTAAFAIAKPGEVVEIDGGTYAELALADMAFPIGQPLVIRPADPSNPPRFTGMTLRSVRNVVVEGMIFQHAAAPDQPEDRSFSVRDSHEVVIRNNLFEGNSDGDGHGMGVGFYSRQNSSLRFEGNEVRGFLRGAMFVRTDGVAVLSNDLHDLRSDGLNFIQVTDAQIEGNLIHDFRKKPGSGDHADMIQFWTAGTEAPSVNITIRDNLLLAGAGGWTQSIFMRNERVDQGQAGDEMFYRDVTIEGNLIVNAHLHGITVGETEGLVIRNNTVVRNPAAEGREANPDLWTPGIRVRGGAREVAILDNVTGALALPNPLPADWRVTGNLMVQDRSRLEPAFYGTVFAGHDAMDPASFRPLPGGPLDGTGVGSPLPGAFAE